MRRQRTLTGSGWMGSGYPRAVGRRWSPIRTPSSPFLWGGRSPSGTPPFPIRFGEGVGVPLGLLPLPYFGQPTCGACVALVPRGSHLCSLPFVIFPEPRKTSGPFRNFPEPSNHQNHFPKMIFHFPKMIGTIPLTLGDIPDTAVTFRDFSEHSFGVTSFISFIRRTF